MSGDKKIETSQLSAPGIKSEPTTKHPEKDTGKDGIPSRSVLSVSSGDITLSEKGASDQPFTSEQGGYYLPASYNDYYYPGYNGSFTQPDDKGFINTPGSSYMGTQQDSALLYYNPGYGPYTTGFVDADGKQAYPSPEYIQVQQPCSYGPDSYPCYTYDSTYVGNGSPSSTSGSMISGGTSGFVKSNGFNVARTNGNLSSETSALPVNSNNQQPNSSRSIHQNQLRNPLNKKFTAGFQSSGVRGGIHPAGNYSSLASQNSRSHSNYGPVHYQANVRTWNNNYRSRPEENLGRSGDNKGMSELTRGPRADNRNNSNSSTEVEQAGFAVAGDKYNLQEFETVYDSAKFYVIKSYSEDDIHKCIKYNVWSSTPNGNKKLDAAFREADAKTREAGKKCPVFLFFSVNGSGQFVGVAEMEGHVDFSKNMDFWQLDKWNGFFPLKWHIIKDVPSTQLRHIILVKNENRPVTYSRDTQEIELKQGLEMLSIFKNYSAKTCVLDDFKFYENREKMLKGKRGGVAAAASQPIGDYEKHFDAGDSARRNELNPSSLVALTNNLSLEPRPL